MAKNDLRSVSKVNGVKNFSSSLRLTWIFSYSVYSELLLFILHNKQTNSSRDRTSENFSIRLVRIMVQSVISSYHMIRVKRGRRQKR